MKKKLLEKKVWCCGENIDYDGCCSQHYEWMCFNTCNDGGYGGNYMVNGGCVGGSPNPIDGTCGSYTPGLSPDLSPLPTDNFQVTTKSNSNINKKSFLREIAIGDDCNCHNHGADGIPIVMDPPYTGNEVGAISMYANGGYYCDCVNNIAPNDRVPTRNDMGNISNTGVKPVKNFKMNKLQLRDLVRESVKELMNELGQIKEDTQEDCQKWHNGYPTEYNNFMSQCCNTPEGCQTSGTTTCSAWANTANTSVPGLDPCECCKQNINTTTGEGCEDSNWINMPSGTTQNPGYSYFKNDYCDRCGSNSSGANFPVVWNNPSVPLGGWFYDPSNGTNYCQCCPDEGTGTSTGEVPCKDLIAQDPAAHAACCKKCKGKGMLQNDPCFAHCKCCKTKPKPVPTNNSPAY